MPANKRIAVRTHTRALGGRHGSNIVSCLALLLMLTANGINYSVRSYSIFVSSTHSLRFNTSTCHASDFSLIFYHFACHFAPFFHSEIQYFPSTTRGGTRRAAEPFFARSSSAVNHRISSQLYFEGPAGWRVGKEHAAAHVAQPRWKLNEMLLLTASEVTSFAKCKHEICIAHLFVYIFTGFGADLPLTWPVLI